MVEQRVGRTTPKCNVDEDLGAARLDTPDGASLQDELANTLVRRSREAATGSLRSDAPGDLGHRQLLRGEVVEEDEEAVRESSGRSRHIRRIALQP
jgi:hypothetical protein